MYFHFENGYDPSDLVVQFRQEKKVAKDIGLTQISHFLGLMENLVCHFHGIRNAESTRTGMSMELIKMRMSNEAERILSNLDDHNPPKSPQRKKRLKKKLYKYPCSVSMHHLCYARDGVGEGAGKGWGF